MASLSLSVLLDPPFYGVFRLAALIVIKQAALTPRSDRFVALDRNIKPRDCGLDFSSNGKRLLSPERCQADEARFAFVIFAAQTKPTDRPE